MGSIETINGNAHAAAARLGIREVVRRLNAALGASMVSAMAGAKDPKASYRWQREDGPVPSDNAQARILLAHRAWTLVADADGDQAARLWFLGANPWLGEVSPVEAIHDGCSKAVMDAAAAMVSGSFNG